MSRADRDELEQIQGEAKNLERALEEVERAIGAARVRTARVEGDLSAVRRELARVGAKAFHEAEHLRRCGVGLLPSPVARGGPAQ